MIINLLAILSLKIIGSMDKTFNIWNTHFMFSLFVDADSVPKKHRDIILKRVIKENICTYFVADRELSDVKDAIREDVNNKRGPYRKTLAKEELKKIKSCIHMIVVSSAPDAADDKIVELSSPPALAITHDILLSKRLIEKGLYVLDDRGNELNKNNINERLSIRNIMAEFRENGIEEEKTKPFDMKVYSAFSSAFDTLINVLKRDNKS